MSPWGGEGERRSEPVAQKLASRHRHPHTRQKSSQVPICEQVRDHVFALANTHLEKTHKSVIRYYSGPHDAVGMPSSSRVYVLRFLVVGMWLVATTSQKLLTSAFLGNLAPCVWYSPVCRSSYPNNLYVQCETASYYRQSNIVVMRIKGTGDGHEIASEDSWSVHHRVKPALHQRAITRSRRFHLISSSGRRSIAQRRKISRLLHKMSTRALMDIIDRTETESVDGGLVSKLSLAVGAEQEQPASAPENRLVSSFLRLPTSGVRESSFERG